MDELANIQGKIYEIRGSKVMLDFDLAGLYHVETKQLKQSVRRNAARFPADFMFELTNDEYNKLKMRLRSQFVTLEIGKYPKYAPFAFTEQGVAMLSGLLNSDVAINTNIKIMRAFVAVRKFALGYAELNQKIENFMIETNMQFNEVYLALIELAEQKKEFDKPRRPIGFKTTNDS